MNIGLFIIQRRTAPAVAPSRGVEASEIFGSNGMHRHVQMIGIISIISNGYLVSLGHGNGLITDVRYACDEQAVGERLLEFVAKEELNK